MAQDREIVGGQGDGATGRRGDGENLEGFIAISHSPRRPVAAVSAVSAVFSTAAARIVSRVPVVDCENSTSFDHREARSGLGHRTDVDQREYPVGAQRHQVAHAGRIALAGKEESAAAAPGDLEIAGAGVELQSAAAAVVLNTDVVAADARKTADRDAHNGFIEAADGVDERRRSGIQVDSVKIRPSGALWGQ